MSDQPSDQQFKIIVWKNGSHSITFGGDNAIHARLSFERLVDLYCETSADYRVELYDGSYLAEDWLSGERARHH